MSTSAANGSNGSKSNRDPAWKYMNSCDGGTNNVECRFCGKRMTAGITRAKNHLIGLPGQVTQCPKCPKEVREELLKLHNEKQKLQKNKIQKEGRTKSRCIDLGGFSDEEAENESEFSPSNASSKASSFKGPMDMFVRKPETAVEKRSKEKMRQMNMREACDKELVSRVHQYIARFWYQAGLSFNLITLPSFEDMVEAIGAYGKHLPIPSYHDIRVPLLKKELDHTNNLLKQNKEEWSEYGCSIMSDGWTDRRQRTIINFLVNSPSGTVFVKSIDGSSFVKTGDKLFELLDSLVEEIGEKNVVQVVTDNGSNYVAAGKKLMEKRPNLYWTPCAAHCLDLMLEDIGKIPLIKRTIRRAISLVGFIYSHTSTLSLLRSSTNKRELVRPAVTRFATSFLSLERIHKEKDNLRRMFASDEWVNNKLSKEAKGKEAMKTVVMPSFWKNVVYILKIMAPLVRVLRLVDGDKRPAMGYIYEAMEKAKETISKSFNGVEIRYQDVFKIIDDRWDCQLHRPLHAAGHFLNADIFYSNKKIAKDLEVTQGLYECIRRLVPEKDDQDKILEELKDYKAREGFFNDPFAIRQQSTIAPAQWWEMYGQSTPTLQNFAIKVLSLTCSASGCERNWSVFEQVHSKKRNRLDHKKMHDLVYVKYNQKLHERHKNRDKIDPISLNDIDECNEWLVGEMDDENDSRNDLVNDDELLDWGLVYEASGLGEPRTYTRRNKGKRKEPPTSSMSGGSSKQGKMASTSKGKECLRLRRLVNEDEDDEDEYEDEDEDDEGEDQEENFEESEGEEEEGFASLDDNEEDDYVGVDDED